MAEKEVRESSVPEVNFNGDKDVAMHEGSIAATPKSRWERSWPVIACGSGELEPRPLEVETDQIQVSSQMASLRASLGPSILS